MTIIFPGHCNWPVIGHQENNPHCIGKEITKIQFDICRRELGSHVRFTTFVADGFCFINENILLLGPVHSTLIQENRSVKDFR